MQLTLELESAWFQPFNLKRDTYHGFSKICFQIQLVPLQQGGWVCVHGGAVNVKSSDP
jgi:hypothetical protein